MNILAIEPYYGGSHKAFIDAWQSRSRHDWTVIGLAARKWKWRMRHSALTCARRAMERYKHGERWDLLFCSDMLNLAEFLGLATPALGNLPSVCYFHENQLTYPVRHADERDYQFVFTNITSALAAEQVWFNSRFHLDSFLEALPGFFTLMPDHRPAWAGAAIRKKAHVQPQGIEWPDPRGARDKGPLHILWAARWEHDKAPETFFEALRLLEAQSVDFRVSVIGEQFRTVPPVFAGAHRRFQPRIARWGYQKTRSEYHAALREADVIVSTARHEFFGISMAEAVAAGAFPLAPRRLAYPEVLNPESGPANDDFFYDGEARGLADALVRMNLRLQQGDLWEGDPERGRRTVRRFAWDTLVPILDDSCEKVGQVLV